MVVFDMDNISLQARSEREDIDLRKNYNLLFHFLKKNMLQPRIPPLVHDKIGIPPFEKPTITKVFKDI